MDIDLLELDSKQGFRLTGAGKSAHAGYSVSGIGDVNRDGFDDFIIGAPGTNALGRYSAGISYVMFGKATCFDNMYLASLSMPNGFQIQGAKENDMSGVSVGRAGDINKDGFDDIIIGAFSFSVNPLVYTGRSYIIFGKATGFSDIDLANLTMPIGFNVERAVGDPSPISVSGGGGDINNDGFDDFIIGISRDSPSFSSGFAGISYVIFGKATGFSDIDLTSLTMPTGFKILGAASGDNSGIAVNRAGDINNDGFDDLIIGANLANPLGRSNAGTGYVIFGKAMNFSDIDLADITASAGFKIQGAMDGDNNGISLSRAGDLNKDGFDDIIIGSYQASPLNRTQAGISYIIFGRATGFSDIDLSTIELPYGFKIMGAIGRGSTPDYPGDNSGYSVSEVGDVNHDGFDDIIIGAWKAYANLESGESYIIYGNNCTI